MTFRGALEALLESLDASLRVARWPREGGDSIPEPLKRSASQLVARLASATRLASGRFVGAPAVVVTSDAIRKAILELEVAYVAYRKHPESGATDEAAVALDGELGRVKTQAHLWE